MMTDEEFDEGFDAMSAEQLLEYLGKYVRVIKMNNGTSYSISNLSDVKAVVEQELYQQLTGRE